ncbi:MAG: c-type cytochrome [Vicinamibacterales bacterium]
MRIRNLIVAAGAAAVIGPAVTVAQQQPAPPAQPKGWIIGEDADTKKNPLAADQVTLATGKGLYKDNCQRCHGPGGLGDGEDADPDARGDMDLTLAKRAARNSDGVVYYKVANGRKKPKMPVFKEELNEQQIWAVVTYVQSLRKKS